jgi:MarR family transcriptional regulator, organic hydroperoxide resistance regulator
MKVIHQHTYKTVEKTKLYPGQPQLLMHIKEKEGITQKELSEKHFVKPSTITGMLIKLEANHYVYRVSDEEDKRIMRVYLTPEGRIMAEKGEKFMQGMTARLFHGFTEEELKTLLYLIQKIKNNMNDNNHSKQ